MDLFSPISLGRYRLANRIVITPHDAQSCQPRQCTDGAECDLLRPKAGGRGPDRHRSYADFPARCRLPGNTRYPRAEAGRGLEAGHSRSPCGRSEPE